MQIFKDLSYGDKLRVSRCLVRGAAPDDPRMAPAAVELAESYKRQKRANTVLMRWAPVMIIVCSVYTTLPDALEGDLGMAIIFGAMVLLFAFGLVFDPATRPKNMARSLEASRRIAGFAER